MRTVDWSLINNPRRYLILFFTVHNQTALQMHYTKPCNMLHKQKVPDHMMHIRSSDHFFSTVRISWIFSIYCQYDICLSVLCVGLIACNELWFDLRSVYNSEENTEYNAVPALAHSARSTRLGRREKQWKIKIEMARVTAENCKKNCWLHR